MPLAARRVFRFGFVVALSLTAAYGLALPLPYLAPVFAVLLTAAPAPPMGLKGLVGVVLVVAMTLGVGVVLIPLLTYFPFTAVLLITVGLFFSIYLAVTQAKGPVGTLLTVGFTMIPAAGLMGDGIAGSVIEALVLGLAVSIICQWLVYPWFPEDAAPVAAEAVTPQQANWLALRATLIVLPPFMLALSNPTLYLPLIMKSVFLGQQGSEVSARTAGRELLSSTLLAGCLGVLFWFALKLHPHLWMFFLWMLLFGFYGASKIYGVSITRYPPSFWINTLVTMLILLGPAVQDSANGKDVYQAFFVRMALFIAVTLYAWGAIAVLERLRARYLRRSAIQNLTVEVS